VSFWGKVVLVSDIDASISDLVSVGTVNCNITHHIPT